ncbi:Helix-turn-helix domain protein [Aquisphaera giovannonii]|uniref:Helix-turn-helix domain protein n=1 Tax=Aquisphaera giovannonii TaxID=406548 RepID=A0A5B9VZ29_9BACT|nr:helix-turn-helix domain-containing protein [Aquisphaera giovannonii]QEH32920.1 Helix-turn-helix domain protein [Aquisphaera giovannonii]
MDTHQPVACEGLATALTLADIARDARRCTRTIQRAVNSGQLPPHDFEVGRARYWRRATVEGWLAGRKGV